MTLTECMGCKHFYRVRFGWRNQDTAPQCVKGVPQQVMVLSRLEGREYHCPTREPK